MAALMTKRTSSDLHHGDITETPLDEDAEHSPDEPKSAEGSRANHGNYDAIPNHDENQVLLQQHYPRGHCVPRCCITHWKMCKMSYIAGIAVVSLLAVTLLSLSVFYGVTSQHTATENSKDIFMSANETYNITNGHQSQLLHKVCMQVETSEIDWEVIKGSCRAKDAPKIEDTILLEGSTTEKAGYLFYLLKGSEVSVQSMEGNVYTKVYLANDNYEVSELESKCINEDPDYIDNCVCIQKVKCLCNIRIEVSAHYYVCLLPDSSPMQYSVSIDRVRYNTSDYEICEEIENVVGASTIEKCCTLSNIFHELTEPECIFLSSHTTNESFLHHAVNVTVTAQRRDSVTGILAGAVIVMVAVLAVLVLMCMIVGYRAKHQDRCNCQISCFHIPNDG